ncbi:hypothetical protein GCM10023321_69990 [Pseudonocardia eucalypti]|uniref:Terpene synthase n=1 Tax=Pseudonocardia eucalypti TaxID=648755 RepID=A0ABP9R4J4_9PSEU|nr:hypothetical protein [Pseudonocardia eucalypti]
MLPLEVPAFYCPLPLIMHPELELIAKGSLDWFQGFGFFPGEERRRALRDWLFTELVAYCYPDDDPDRVQLMADLVHWTTFDDSQIDGDDSYVRDTCTEQAGGLLALSVKLVRMLETGDPDLLPSDPWIGSLFDLRRRVAAIATPAQLARWTGAFREYLLAAAWKNSCARRRIQPSLADYLTMRTAGGGVQLYTTLSDVVGGYQLTDAELSHPPVRALTDMAHTIVAWDNDLFSDYKETLTEDPAINLVTVLAAEHGYDKQRAVPVAMAMRDRALGRYLRVLRHTGDSLTEAQRRYVLSLSRWIASNIETSALSTRYTNPLDQPAAAMPHAEFATDRTAAPTDDNPTPLPFPTIAWWWNESLAPR